MSRVGDNIVPHQIKTPSELRPSHQHFCHIRCQAYEKLKIVHHFIFTFDRGRSDFQVFRNRFSLPALLIIFRNAWWGNKIIRRQKGYLESWRISGEVLQYYEKQNYLCVDRSHHNSLPWINILYRPSEAQQWNVWTEQLSISCCTQIKPGLDMFVSYVNYEVCCNVTHSY